MDKVLIGDFEGPLDLLCHLIDKNKMDICDINISDITDQYIAYLNKMEELNLEIASEFVIMASTLLYLKSKTLHLQALHTLHVTECTHILFQTLTTPFLLVTII